MASRTRHFYTTIAGVTGRVPPFADQTDKLYNSEHLWAHNYPKAGQSISEQGAKDLVGEILHHKALDSFPDIHHLRETWKPEERITFDPQVKGIGSTSYSGDINFNPEHKLKVGTVTHESSHLANLLGHQFEHHIHEGDGFDHEWPFAATHLHVVHNLYGKEASIPLKNAYRMFGTKWQPKRMEAHDFSRLERQKRLFEE